MKAEAQKSKNTSLKISYDDNYLVFLNHENGTKGVLAVDVVTRKPVRRLEIFGEDLYLSWNGTPDSLMDYNMSSPTNGKITPKIVRIVS